MSIHDYWSKPPSEQQEIIQSSIPAPYQGRCGGIVIHPDPQSTPINPCLALYGNGPDGAICRYCVHCRYRAQSNRVRYWKCDLRKLTHGAATDHRVGWPACGRYEKRTEEYHGG